MRDKVKALVARLVSLFTLREVIVGWERSGRTAKLRGFKRGLPVVFTIPLIAGAAFEVLQVTLPAVAAAAGTTVPASLGEVPQGESEGSFQVYRVSITAPAAVTGNSANSATLYVRQMRAGAPVTTNGQTSGYLASLALVTGTNLVADQPVAMTIVGTPALLPGDELDVVAVQIGTGLAIPAGTTVHAEIG